MRNLKYLPLVLIACINLSIFPAKATETSKDPNPLAKYLVEKDNQPNELNYEVNSKDPTPPKDD